MRQKIQAGLRAATVLLALKAAVGGFAAVLALYGIGADYLGYSPSALSQGGVSSLGALAAALAALRA